MPQKTHRDPADTSDTPALRKARGAYFTPPAIARFVADWAVRDARDRVLEPSCGDAEFLVHAVRRLRDVGADRPRVDGVEVHGRTAASAAARVLSAGGDPCVIVSDFFEVLPDQALNYQAVIGNPPYIRYQELSDRSRAAATTAVAAAGSVLAGHASSWAAFTIHATQFLAPGGRLAFVLPAELLTVDYAAPIRRLLLREFASVELVTFAERVFAGADVAVVLVLADGYGGRPAADLGVSAAADADSLDGRSPARSWAPVDPGQKWMPGLVESDALAVYSRLAADGFTVLGTWGDTRLGIVTGNNAFFALSAAAIQDHGLEPSDIRPLSPPKSAHLRGLDLTGDDIEELARDGKPVWLFSPDGEPSAAAHAYIDAGALAGADTGYKCRARKTWWRVPVSEPPHLFITVMNAETPRMTTNRAGVHHLNSVNGIYLRDDVVDVGRDLLPLAALNTLTLLGAELVGRSYGGGVLKLEPGEAGHLPVPTPELVRSVAEGLRGVRGDVVHLLGGGRLLDAVAIVDDIVLGAGLGVGAVELRTMREARAGLADRRRPRGRGAG